MMPAVEFHIITSADRCVKPGEAHLLIAHADWQSVHEFFLKHCEVWEPIREADGWPTGYRRKLSDRKSE